MGLMCVLYKNGSAMFILYACVMIRNHVILFIAVSNREGSLLLYFLYLS